MERRVELALRAEPMTGPSPAEVEYREHRCIALLRFTHPGDPSDNVVRDEPREGEVLLVRAKSGGYWFAKVERYRLYRPGWCVVCGEWRVRIRFDRDRNCWVALDLV